MNWDISSSGLLEDHARANRTVILPIGSTEQHGPHLPVGTDTMLCHAVAERAARMSRGTAIVLPPLWISLAEHHMPFGGTLTLTYEELSSILGGIVGSVARQGFAKVILLNGHGGNMAALPGIADALTRKLGLTVATTTYWMLARQAFGDILEDQPNLRHACEAETSMMLALRPDLVDLAQATEINAPADFPEGGEMLHSWKTFTQLTPSGVVGVLKNVSAEKGEVLLDAAATALKRAMATI